MSKPAANSDGEHAADSDSATPTATRERKQKKRARAPRRAPAPHGAVVHRGWLYPVVFFAGASFMALEIVGSRVLAPFFGNSVFVWGSLIGVFLTALSLGYILGGRLSERWPSTMALGLVLTIAAALAAFINPLAEPIQEWVVTWGLPSRFNPLVAAMLIFTPASVLMGMVSPYAVRLSTRNVETSGSTAGTLYGVSTIGSIVGTLAAAFWLIPSFGTSANLAWIAVAIAACAITTAIAGRAWEIIVAAGLVLVLSVSAAAGGDDPTDFQVQSEDWSPVFREADYQSDVEVGDDASALERVDSRYHQIAIAEVQTVGDRAAAPDGRDALRLMKFNNSWQAGAIVKDGEVDPITTPHEFRYINALLLMHAYRPDIESVLYIGLGSGQVAMRHSEINPDVEIDSVEIDPTVEELAEKWFELDTDRMDIHIEDGRTWLASSDRKWDAIVVDAYFADSIPFQMTTIEFMQELEDHLNPGGIVAANIIGAPEGSRSGLFRSLYKTYSEQFEDVVIHPVGPSGSTPSNFDPTAKGKAGMDDFQNIELFASDSSLAGYNEVVERAQALAKEPVFEPRMVDFAKYRYDAPIDLDGVPVLTDEYAPVEALLELGYDS